MPFLSLPTELRYEIYAIIAIPTCTPHSASTGLSTSCHQIASEMDDECPKRLLTYLSCLTSPAVKLLDPPTSFRACQHLQISLDHTLYRASPAPKELLELAKLHLKAVTLISHVGPQAVVSETYTTDLIRFIGEEVVGEEARVEKWVVRMPRANKELAVWWVECARKWKGQGKGEYGFGWEVGREGVRGVWGRGGVDDMVDEEGVARGLVGCSV